jgi:2-polyprenyl-3-methyl-5-hydroxy-6-metoxy-1,4-benzoquinol methylase
MGDPWDMSQAETARRALEDVCSGRELDRVGEVYHPQFVDHVNALEYHGLAGARKSVAVYLALFPDLRFVRRVARARRDAGTTPRGRSPARRSPPEPVPRPPRQSRHAIDPGASSTARNPRIVAVMQVRDAQGAEPAAIATVADLDGRRVLEVGCGDGRLTRFAACHALEVYAFDPNGDRVAEAAMAVADEDRARVRFGVHDADALDVERHRFDLALCGWSL